MKGTRPLNNDEIRRVSTCFTGNPYEVRNRGLFMLGVSIGGRFETLIQCKHYIADSTTDDQFSSIIFAREIEPQAFSGYFRVAVTFKNCRL